VAVEGLDQRCLLDAGAGHVMTNLVSDMKGLAPNTNEDFGHNGVVVKAPHFDENDDGPHLAQWNAVAAAGELLPNGSFEFVGVNQGAINPRRIAKSFRFALTSDPYS
jgi:hypothetical protein